MLVIFSGGSGVGKNTVIAELIKTGGFALLPTYTTRKKRPTESEGNPYCFVDEETFKKKIEEKELYEYENVHGHYYGTSKKLLKERLALGKILLKDIDVLGTQNLVKSIGKDVKIVTLFLKVDSKEVLVKRLTERKETEIEKRLARYDMEMTYCDKYDYIINNEELYDTVKTVLAIVKAESENAEINTAEAVIPSAEEISDLVNRLNNGETLPPVKVALHNGEFVVAEGGARYLAGLKSGKRVAKEIVKTAVIPVGGEKWRAAIENAKR
ncbi:MAG: hypothetical protein IJU83_00085 [Clostridia bacterium]|nr:hypothetical protein [Clostridia bacterium]